MAFRAFHFFPSLVDIFRVLEFQSGNVALKLLIIVSWSLSNNQVATAALIRQPLTPLGPFYSVMTPETPIVHEVAEVIFTGTVVGFHLGEKVALVNCLQLLAGSFNIG
jgi:hypothetical protein